MDSFLMINLVEKLTKILINCYLFDFFRVLLNFVSICVGYKGKSCLTIEMQLFVFVI